MFLEGTKQGATSTESLHQVTVALLWRLAWVLRLFDLLYHQLKSLADVLVVPRARFGPAALQLLCYLLALLRTDLPLLGAEVALVSYDDNGDCLGTLSISPR